MEPSRCSGERLLARLRDEVSTVAGLLRPYPMHRSICGSGHVEEIVYNVSSCRSPLLHYYPIRCCSAAAFLCFFFHAIMAIEQNFERDSSGHGSDAEKASPHSPPLSSAASSDLDDNYVLYKQHEGDAPADAAEAKSVLRKVDWRVMPVLFTLYLLQYLDKNGLNYVCFVPSFLVEASSSICWMLVLLCVEALHDRILTFVAILRLVLSVCKKISVSRVDNMAGSDRSSTSDTLSHNFLPDGRCSDCLLANSLVLLVSLGASF